MKLKQYLTEGKEDKVTEFLNGVFGMSDINTDDIKKMSVAAKKMGRSYSMDNYILDFTEAVTARRTPVGSRQVVQGTKMSFFNFIQYMIKHKAKMINVSKTFTEK